MAFLKAAAIAVAFFLLPIGMAFAQAAVPASTVDLNPLIDATVKVVADFVIIVGGIVGLWLAAELKAKWNIDIRKQVTDLEANYRDTLHSAVETWTRAEIAKRGPNLTFDIGSPELANVINGVAKSAPDAVAYLKPTEQWIAAKAAGVLGVTAPVLG